MRRCIAYAGLLLLMMGWPMNVEAGQDTGSRIPHGTGQSMSGLVPHSVHTGLLQDEPFGFEHVKHHEAGG